jgi:hypothetical protein
MNPEITPDHLDRWADSPDSVSGLPDLIASLVAATARGMDSCRFPSGKGTNAGGWDGVTQVREPSLNVPDGAAGWELGTEEKPQQKANRDYRDRLAQLGAAERKNITFVAVTPRRWRDVEEWVTQKSATGEWRDVRGIDAHTLSTWLGLAPAVRQRFADRIGTPGTTAHDVESWWEQWALATIPPLTSEVVLAGRDSVVATLRERLGTSVPEVIILRAELPELATAVVAASILSDAADSRQKALARTLVVDDRATWNAFCRTESQLVLIPAFVDRDVIGVAVNHGHKVVIVLGDDAPDDANVITVPPLGAKPLALALSDLNKTELEVEDLLQRCGGSLHRLRQRMYPYTGGVFGGWSATELGSALVPLFLAGAWDEDADGDRAAVSRLTQSDYREIRAVASRARFVADSPILKIGSVWKVSPADEAWRLLHPYLNNRMLESFVQVASEVLEAPDPRFELPASERWSGAAMGYAPAHSSHLREGLAEMVAVMGAVGAEHPVTETLSSADGACQIVRRVLGSGKWETWASLDRLVPFLAEACPDSFLDSVFQALTGDHPLLLELFQDSAPGFFGGAPWVGLVWALECLAWSPDYVASAAVGLARLADLDPGGNSGPRPLSSLTAIFFPWLPQSNASSQRLLQVLDTLRRETPDVAWQAALGAAPSARGTVISAYKPRWRRWAAQQAVIEPADLWAGILNRLLVDADDRTDRWAQLIPLLDDLPQGSSDVMLSALAGLSTSTWGDDRRAAIWNPLRALVVRHRRFPTAHWVLPEPVLTRLEEIKDQFAPESARLRVEWLFSVSAELPIPSSEADLDMDSALGERRRQAVSGLYGSGGLDEVVALASAVEAPWMVGVALAEAVDTVDVIATTEELIQRAVAPAQRLARAYLLRSAEIQGPDWTRGRLADTHRRLWPDDWVATLLLALPFEASTWTLAQEHERHVVELYWSQVPLSGHGPLDQDAVATIISSLLNFEQFARALDFLALYRQQASADLVISVLERALAVPDTNVPWQALSWEIGNLLEFAVTRGAETDRIARLEWLLLPILNVPGHSPRALLQTLAQDPSFYVEVLTGAFRAEGEPAPTAVDERTRLTALRAYQLLRAWRTPPGTREDGTIDGEVLAPWITSARAVAAVRGRRGIADEQIGELLSGSGAGEDGVWPDTAVRDALERTQSEAMEKGLLVGGMSRRGVFWKDLREGGSKEREMAARYFAGARDLAERWPRTAAVLRRLGDHYEWQARRADNEAWLNDG